MNFTVDCSEGKSPCLRRVVPLLLLIKEWGDLGVDAFEHVDIVLLLLQGIQLGDDDKAMHVLELKKRLMEISSSVAAKYEESMEKICKDLSSFMDLFDDLSKLFEPPDDVTPTLLDADCKHSVLGVFVQRCVLEYKRLTFSQLVRLHTSLLSLQQTEKTTDTRVQDEECKGISLHLKELNFSAALNNLRLCHGLSGSDQEQLSQRRLMSGDHELGKEALQLTELHGRFGHKEEGVFALQEAIRLAQQHNNAALLEHTLAWLHKLQPCSGEDILVILNKYVKNAIDLKMPALGIWGRLQQAKTKLELSQEPKSVLDVVMASEAEFGSIQEFGVEKKSMKEQASILSFMAATWDLYGRRLQGLLHSQLLCHLMPCDGPSSRVSKDEEEAIALSLSMMARYLSETGEFNSGQAILMSAKTDYLSKQSSKILNLCLEELLFDRSLTQEDFSKAQHHLNNITALDNNSSQYRSALLCKAEGNLHKAVAVTRKFLERLETSVSESPCKLYYKARNLILLAEVYSDLGHPALALPHVMDCLTLCEINHLPSQRAKLCLAQLQLQMDSPSDCLETVKDCMLYTQSEGSFRDRGMACFLMVQATLLLCKQRNQSLSKQDALAVHPILSQVIQFFQKISDNAVTRMAMLLQIHICSYLGLDEEKDQYLSQLKHM